MSISESKQKVPEDLRHKLEQTVASTEEQALIKLQSNVNE
jgi:hypothetical protein